MKTPYSQRGVVLIVSLIMLLLIMLLGSNMILQNRLQFMMASNSQAQTTAFASAEDLLELAETYIDAQRYFDSNSDGVIDLVDRQASICNKTAAGEFDQLRPDDITANLSLSDATKLFVVQMTQTACMPDGGQELQCTPDASDPTIWSPNEPNPCNRSDRARCPTELYSLQISSQDPSTGSARIVESKYAVRCNG